MANQFEILDNIAERSVGSAQYRLGGQAVAQYIRENGAGADELAHMLATALNDIALLKEQLARLKAPAA
jgi:hypothetical protein